ncbi:MAG: PfkB family carbohydrate kinase [Acidimicrobiia bacterium]|nr:PfkB family carbohydrate kinase [Acidimicrobiia bacterium]
MPRGAPEAPVPLTTSCGEIHDRHRRCGQPEPRSGRGRPPCPHRWRNGPGRRSPAVPGGKGGNQATAAARLGRSVAMIGRVGVDDAGDQLLGALDGDGVDTACSAPHQRHPLGRGADHRGQLR